MIWQKQASVQWRVYRYGLYHLYDCVWLGCLLCSTRLLLLPIMPFVHLQSGNMGESHLCFRLRPSKKLLQTQLC